MHALSRTWDPTTFVWTDDRWTGRQLEGSCVYELHVGTFTPEGTLDAAVGKLDHLVDLGVDLIELLPVNSFNGAHNWGYDGVLWFAVADTYGGPGRTSASSTSASAAAWPWCRTSSTTTSDRAGTTCRGSGRTSTSPAPTPWGASINLERATGASLHRRQRAMWLRDYHVDALRLDAVHALVDTSPKHLLQELAEEVDALSPRSVARSR